MLANEHQWSIEATQRYCRGSFRIDFDTSDCKNLIQHCNVFESVVIQKWNGCLNLSLSKDICTLFIKSEFVDNSRPIWKLYKLQNLFNFHDASMKHRPFLFANLELIKLHIKQKQKIMLKQKIDINVQKCSLCSRLLFSQTPITARCQMSFA